MFCFYPILFKLIGMKRLFLLFPALVLLAALPAVLWATAGNREFPYPVSGAFVRATPAKISAGYMVIKNPTRQDDALVAASAPWAAKTELHTIEKDKNGILSMKQVSEMPLPARGTLALKNGGYHIMFYGVKTPLKEGENASLTLRFRRAGSIILTVPIKPITYRPD